MVSIIVVSIMVVSMMMVSIMILIALSNKPDEMIHIWKLPLNAIKHAPHKSDAPLASSASCASCASCASALINRTSSSGRLKGCSLRC